MKSFLFETHKPEVWKTLTHPDTEEVFEYSNHGRMRARGYEVQLHEPGSYHLKSVNVSVRGVLLAYKYDDNRFITGSVRPVYLDDDSHNLQLDNITLRFEVSEYFDELPNERWICGRDGYEYSHYGRRRLESNHRICNESIGLKWIQTPHGYILTSKDDSEAAKQKRKSIYYKAMRLFNERKLPSQFKVEPPITAEIPNGLLNVFQARLYIKSNRNTISRENKLLATVEYNRLKGKNQPVLVDEYDVGGTLPDTFIKDESDGFFKPIPGFPRHSIGLDGVVINRSRKAPMNRVPISDTGVYKLSRPGGSSTRHVSHFLYLAYRGEIPSGFKVIPKNGNLYDIRLENLILTKK